MKRNSESVDQGESVAESFDRMLELRRRLTLLSSKLLSPDEPSGDPGDLQMAAVLVGFVTPDVFSGKVDELELLLIERAHSLRQHAGQLAFPGGKHDPSDGTLLETALRETHEEIGVPRRNVEILGRLTPVAVPSGYWVVPFVGWIDAPRPWALHQNEVARTLRAPLRELKDPARWIEDGSRRYQGQDYVLHRFTSLQEHWQGAQLWGASARMVRELLSRMDGL
jgi:8-oxo-dGTP pyrophosphatase MutT (NUDIX family)